MCTTSTAGSLYVATFLDDFSGYGVIFPLRRKDQLHQAFTKYWAWATTQTGRQLRTLRTDRGGEYTGAVFWDELAARGIEHQQTVPYSPQQNGRAERWNRSLLERTLALLHDASLSAGFWEFAFRAATHTYNISPMKRLGWLTPHHKWTGSAPDVSHLRVFGCLAWVRTPDVARTKLDPKAKKCLFLGYEAGTKGWVCWDNTKRAVITS